MNNLIEIDNPEVMIINSVNYKGIQKIKFLKNKKKIIKSINKKNLIALGYVYHNNYVFGGESMESTDTISELAEYIFFHQSDGKIAYTLICGISFENEDAADNYIDKLERKNYIELPLNWKQNSQLLNILNLNEEIN